MPTLIKGKIGREYFTQSGRGWGQVLKSSIYLVGLVYLVCLVYLVLLVGLVGLEGEGEGVFFLFT